MDIEEVKKYLLEVKNLVNNPPDDKIKETSKSKVQFVLLDLQNAITENEYALKQAKKIGTLFNVLYGPAGKHAKHGGVDTIKKAIEQHLMILEGIIGNL